MPSLNIQPNADKGGGQGLMGDLLSKMRNSGVDFSGNRGLTEGQKKTLRDSGVSVYKKGGKVSASSRADGCATKGKTKGRII